MIDLYRFSAIAAAVLCLVTPPSGPRLQAEGVVAWARGVESRGGHRAIDEPLHLRGARQRVVAPSCQRRESSRMSPEGRQGAGRRADGELRLPLRRVGGPHPEGHEALEGLLLAHLHFPVLSALVALVLEGGLELAAGGGEVGEFLEEVIARHGLDLPDVWSLVRAGRQEPSDSVDELLGVRVGVVRGRDGRVGPLHDLGGHLEGVAALKRPVEHAHEVEAASQ